ncbi:hypothetical protein BDQ12DRAFT_685924 [Crucibulum laeve]|uniref:HAD-like domain-containing protein n=1 Tax=Crucibulum laeve TaxID=68775 RepID=A0A5C3LWQ4_9AGAR|nr:hypothetical protein BDQ12DRAFT_685924 [Crucibulum laeve]
MSIAASKLELESPSIERSDPLSTLPTQERQDGDSEQQPEKEALERLTVLSPPSTAGAVIAIDLDDVLCQTNEIVAEWHNQKFGTQMNLSHFYYYYYWKNPFWGTPKVTFDKVKEFYSTDMIYRTKPVPGAREGVQTLRDMGYRLIIVTARAEDHADESWQWVNKHFPGIFDSVICTGQFKDAIKTGHEIVTKLSKAQVCNDLGAKLLIDDSAENAIQVVTATKPTPVLLFGNYPWNQRISGSQDARDEMSFDIRFEASGGHEFWKDETIPVPDGAPLLRVKDWSEVVRWVHKARNDGKM